MCGIAGVLGQHVDRDLLAPILVQLQVRGSDAAGASTVNPKREIYAAKSGGMEAKKFVECGAYRKFYGWAKNSQIAMLHTRQASHGSPKNDHNNHPIYHEDGMIIHNGIVHLDEHYPEAIGQTDTEQMLCAVDKYGLAEAITKTSGWLAIAYLDFDNPEGLYLYRHAAPMVIAWKNEQLFFCSQLSILEKAIGKTDKSYSLKQDMLYFADAATAKVKRLEEVTPAKGYVSAPHTYVYHRGDYSSTNRYLNSQLTLTEEEEEHNSILLDEWWERRLGGMS